MLDSCEPEKWAKSCFSGSLRSRESTANHPAARAAWLAVNAEGEVGSVMDTSAHPKPNSGDNMFIDTMKACAVASSLAMFALAQDSDPTQPPPVEKIDQSQVNSIQAQTLPFNSQAARLILAIPAELSALNIPGRSGTMGNIDSGVAAARTAGMAPGASANSSSDPFAFGDRGALDQYVKDVNAMRIFAFTTQPGETLTFIMKSEQWKVRMGVFTDPVRTKTNSKLKAAIQKANMPMNSARAKKLVFTNTSKEPYDMLLMVYGMHGFEFNMSFESKLKK